MRKLNPIGDKYGKLKVIAEHSAARTGHRKFICVCECGNKTTTLLTHLRQGNTKSCGCDVPRLKGAKHKQWTGVGEMSGGFWYTHIVRSANGDKRRKIDMDITKEYVWDLFINQKRRCALSGIELKFPERFKDKSWTASLDRIDSSKGYVKGNVQWVHKDINMMKNVFSQDYFIKMCKLIATNTEDACEVM